MKQNRIRTDVPLSPLVEDIIEAYSIAGCVTDPMGSYTGQVKKSPDRAHGAVNAVISDEVPVQDADDL